MASWKLYDDLIDGIPAGAKVADHNCGVSWTSVASSEGNIALAMTGEGDTRPFSPLYRILKGSSLRDAAALVKSWNFLEAGVGLAAINSYYNTSDRVADCGVSIVDHSGGSKDAFDVYGEAIKGKRVAVIGCFPRLYRYEEICDLIILERSPDSDEYPDSACEFLLHDRDYIFATGITLINKTFPRLLELGAGARVVIVGPSTPMAPPLFANGVYGLSGIVMKDVAACDAAVRSGSHKAIFRCGEFVDRVAERRVGP